MASANIRTVKALAAQEDYYTWEGRDKSGKVARGELRAANISLAKWALRRQGILPHKLKRRSAAVGRAIKGKDIAQFTRQLGTLLAAGLPVLQCLDLLARSHPNERMMRMINEIRVAVQNGASLSQAMRQHPKCFDPMYCALVESGEAGGVLEGMLRRLAHFQERRESLLGQLRSAMIYPLVIVFVGLLVMAILLIFVIPSFKEAFRGAGAELPAFTLTVLAASDFLVANWFFPLAGSFAAVQGLIIWRRRSAKMRLWMDRLLLRVPVFGPLVEKATIARWTRTLSTLLAAGVPLAEALRFTGQASGNAVFGKANEAIEAEVRTGVGLTTAMRGAGVFTPMALQITSIGEEAGSLDDMLGKVSDIYEAEVEEIIKNLSAIMEPAVIVTLALIFGPVLIAMYLPIFNLGNIF